MRAKRTSCIRLWENKKGRVEKVLYSQISFTIYDRFYISCLKLIFKQVECRVGNGNAIEYVTRRGILLVGYFIPKFVIFFSIETSRDLRHHQGKHNIDGKITRQRNVHLWYVIKLRLVGHLNRKTIFFIKTNTAFSSRLFAFNVQLNLQSKKSR